MCEGCGQSAQGARPGDATTAVERNVLARAMAMMAATAHAAARIAGLALASNHATDQQAAERLAICTANQCGVYNNGWCGTPLQAEKQRSCGCHVALKAHHKDERCPQGLWKDG